LSEVKKTREKGRRERPFIEFLSDERYVNFYREGQEIAY